MTYYGSFGGDNCAKEPQFTITNADRIRAMTDEELAEIIECQDSRQWDECYQGDCKECLLDWLKQEVDDG